LDIKGRGQGKRNLSQKAKEMSKIVICCLFSVAAAALSPDEAVDRASNELDARNKALMEAGVQSRRGKKVTPEYV